jgi:hypothetical protein
MTSMMHLKNGRRAGNCAYTWKGNTLKVRPVSPKLVFDHMAASVLEIMHDGGIVSGQGSSHI